MIRKNQDDIEVRFALSTLENKILDEIKENPCTVDAQIVEAYRNAFRVQVRICTNKEQSFRYYRMGRETLTLEQEEQKG